ncbi:MAG TPA: hypothetical protein VK158_02510, partial [Acidobacteriota bacterium]|nr:hypothetical protein [Acidobacteriota bacterium]
YGSEGRVLRISQGNASIIQNRTATFRTNIFISPWYPKLIGNQTEYEFTCNPIDGSGNYTYDWLLGDGDALYNDNYNKKLHTYPYSNNEYNVVCTAHDLVSGQSTSANMTINPSKYIAEQQ